MAPDCRRQTLLPREHRRALFQKCFHAFVVVGAAAGDLLQMRFVLQVVFEIVQVGVVDRAFDQADAANSAAGKTRATRPMRCASLASTVSPSSSSSIALLKPTSRVRMKLPPESGARPTRTKDWINFASSEATRRSQASAKLQPAPAATPLTAAITIVSIRRIWRIIGLYF